MRKWAFYVRAVESYRITACEHMHLVKRGHFRSRDKDGGHTVGSAIPENPMVHANPMALFFYRPGATGDRSFHCRNRTFLSFCSCDLDLNPMTFLYELDPYSREIHRMCKYELPTSRLWKVIVWQTYTQSDKLRVVTSGHVTKMAVTPFDPPYSKPNAARKLNNLLYLLQKRSYGWSKFTLR